MTSHEIFKREITFLSETHFRLGIDLALRGKGVEDSGISDYTTRGKSKQYAIGAIVSAANSMEASINQFFNYEVEDTSSLSPLDLSDAERDNIISWWNPNSRMPIVNKYQEALTRGGKDPFDTRANPYKDAELLNMLRNKVVHYKPNWIEIGGPEQIEQIYGVKFPVNKLFKDYPTYFPNRCLGFGCAKWALETTYNIVEEFYRRMGKCGHFSSFLEKEMAQL